jgi:hypothetical protein
MNECDYARLCKHRCAAADNHFEVFEESAESMPLHGPLSRFIRDGLTMAVGDRRDLVLARRAGLIGHCLYCKFTRQGWRAQKDLAATALAPLPEIGVKTALRMEKTVVYPLVNTPLGLCVQSSEP